MGKVGLDLGQFGSADKWVALLQESPSGTFVVVGAVVCLCVAVCGAKVVTTPENRSDKTDLDSVWMKIWTLQPQNSEFRIMFLEAVVTLRLTKKRNSTKELITQSKKELVII